MVSGPRQTGSQYPTFYSLFPTETHHLQKNYCNNYSFIIKIIHLLYLIISFSKQMLSILVMYVHRQYTKIVRKYKIYLYVALETGRKAILWQLFYPVSQQVQINYIFSDNVCILYLSCNVKKNITTAKLSKKSRNKRRSNRFLMASSVKSALKPLPFLIIAQHELSNRIIILHITKMYPVKAIRLLK